VISKVTTMTATEFTRNISRVFDDIPGLRLIVV
jgi:hypothetical protein